MSNLEAAVVVVMMWILVMLIRCLHRASQPADCARPAASRARPRRRPARDEALVKFIADDRPRRHETPPPPSGWNLDNVNFPRPFRSFAGPAVHIPTAPHSFPDPAVHIPTAPHSFPDPAGHIPTAPRSIGGPAVHIVCRAPAAQHASCAGPDAPPSYSVPEINAPVAEPPPAYQDVVQNSNRTIDV